MTRDEIAGRLQEARIRTLALVAPLSEADLRRQHDPLMSPIIWDLGHIAHFEELWLVRNLEGPVEFGEMPGLYNPFEHPRRERGALPLPTLAEARSAMDDVRRRTLKKLSSVSLDGPDALLRNGYVYAMVLQHEYQHNETILQTLQLKQGGAYSAPRAYTVLPLRDERSGSGDSAGRRDARMVRFDGGAVTIGTQDRGESYDNERPAHTRVVAPFEIDIYPVTNSDYLEFMRDDGYGRRSLWTDAGWRWRTEAVVEAPKYWRRDGDGWSTRVMNDEGAVDPDRPVCHVCYHEAEAFARFAGKRLPTEVEWEVAAGWNPASGTMQRFPWGDTPATPQRANVDQLSFSTAPVGTYGDNWSPLGCYGMIGDVWEWTSSDFGPYPRYKMFPYPEYSQTFFGSEYKVLRGGSWATRPGAIRNSFRNWDYPIRRQIFSGFRCARDG